MGDLSSANLIVTLDQDEIRADTILVKNLGQRDDLYYRVDEYDIAADSLKDYGWMTAAPAADTIAAGEEQKIVIIFNAAGLKGAMSYAGGLQLKNNDLRSPVIQIPVTMQVNVVDGIAHDRIARVFDLQQNYPNPFNPATTIRYSIPVASDVELTIYNLAGQKISTLVREHQPHGNYAVNFDGAGLASGMYIYHLRAGNFVQTRKMILLK